MTSSWRLCTPPAPGLERYRRYLTDARRRKAHILSPAEEKLLAAAGEMADTPTIFLVPSPTLI